MNIKDLVPDLSICQEAKEKGVVIESSFHWFEAHEGSDTWYLSDKIGIPGCGYVPAPLTDEILQVLPKNILKNSKTYWLTIDKAGDCFNAYYKNDETLERNPRFNDKKLSNALLLLAIELKKEGII